MRAGALTVTLRRAEQTDDDRLRELFADSRPELALLPPQTRAVLIDMQFRAQRRQYAASYPHARREIIVAGGSGVGQIVIDDAPDVVRIVDVTVHHVYRGRGIGSRILRDLITDAGASGRPVRLSVWSGNVGAHRLYAQLGFVRVDDAVTEATGYLEMQSNASQQGDRRRSR